MASITVTLSGVGKPYPDQGLVRDTPHIAIRQIINMLEGAVNGGALGNPKLAVCYSASDAVSAYSTVTISSGSGSIAATIAGTAVSVTWGTSDTATATALAAAINANSTVNKLVYATSAAGVVTVTALMPAALANQITFAASGTGATAGNTSGGKMQSGVGADLCQFNGSLMQV